MKQKVLITGATGFVGRHLISFLNPSEFAVYGTSYPEKPLPLEENISFLDIRSEAETNDVLKQIEPDWIFHLAAISNVRSSWEIRKETLETNFIGSFNLFEAVRKYAPEARILFISSSDIYGILTPSEKILNELDPYHIVNPYALSKVGAELLSEFYAKIENIDIIIARPFPHTGPGQSPDFVCSDWASQIARIEKGFAEPVIKVGNIDIKRDFTDVRDIVRAYFLLMQKGRKGEIYNICSGKAISLGEILELLLTLSFRKITVKTDPTKFRKAEIPLLLGNNQKIQKETSWLPQIPLKKSLTDLLEYWRNK